MSKRLLLLGLVISSLVCSGYSYIGEDSHVRIEVTEDYVPETEEIGTIKLDGKYIKLPCEVALFTNLGYSVGSEADKVLPAESESYSTRLFDEKGREITLFVRNDENIARDVTECMVWGIVYKPVEDTQYGHIDLAFSGVTPTAKEPLMIEKLGLPKTSMDIDGAKYVLWYTPKDEYTVAIDYINDDILQMKLTSDTPEKQLQDSFKLYLGLYEEEDEPGGGYVAEPAAPRKSNIGTLVKIVLGVFGALFVAIVAIVVIAIRLHHKRRMAEIDLAILNTPLEEMPNDLEEKYKV